MGVGKNRQTFGRTMLSVGQLLRRMHPHPRHPRGNWMVSIPDMHLKVHPRRMAWLQTRSFGDDHDLVIAGYRQARSE